LKADSSVAREIPAGASHTFFIKLEAKQYLRISIEKGDLNLSLMIYGPNGERVLECVDHEYRSLDATLVTTSSGSYRMTVTSLEDESSPRRYELRLGSPTRVEPGIMDDIRAALAFNEADQLLASWNEASLLRAIDRFKEAGFGWRRIRPDKAVDAIRCAAGVHFILGNFTESLRLNTEAATESKHNGDRLRNAAALIAIGQSYSALGKNALAREFLEKGLLYADRSAPAYGSMQEQYLAAEARNYLGGVYYSQGSSIKANDYFKQALERWTKLGYRRGQAQAKLNIGYASSASGSQKEALTQFNEAMQLFRAIADRRGEALSITAIGSVYSLQGNEQAALDSHLSAMRMLREIGDRQGIAITFNGVGQAYEDLGDKQAALDNYAQSLELFEKNESIEYASVSEYKIAKLYRALGNLDQAFAHYDRCIQLSRAARRHRIEAYALKDIAEIYYSQKRRRETLAQYHGILKLYRKLGDLRGQAMTLNSIGDLFFGAEEKLQALDTYKRALPLIRSAGDRAEEISTLYRIGRTARASDRLVDALNHVEQSIKMIEALRTYVASPELRSSYFAAVHQNYELYIQILMEFERQQPGRGYAALALQASEGARARALIEVLAEAGADLRQGIDPKQIERDRDLQESLAAKERYQMQLSNSTETQAEIAKVAREIRQLTTEEEMLQAQMREQNPRYAALSQPKPLNLEQIQNELRNEDTLLLEYALGDDKSYLWAVTQNSVSSFELPPRATIEAAARALYDLLTTRQRIGTETNYTDQVSNADSAYPKIALSLSRTLLGPVTSQLGNKRLLIVADGVLQYIPFDALPVPSIAGPQPAANEERALVSDHEVITLPSMSVLAAVRQETGPNDSPRRTLSIFADPVFEADDPRVRNLNATIIKENANTSGDSMQDSRDFAAFRKEGAIPRLPRTLDEAKAILSLLPSDQARSATDFDADRASTMNSDLEHSQIIHFATHSLVNTDQPKLSGILLSMVDRRGARQNGFLQLRDIYSLKLSAKLVVLSACSTGLGKEVKGEGLIGLTRGFMYAGSKSVVASLWKVDDRATTELMSRFYSAMLRDNLPPPAALRLAKESMMKEKRWRAPYYWAGFVIQGEYRDRVKIERSRSRFSYVILGVLMLLICAYGVYTIAIRRKASLIS
jgi:CHAT domain-containing protein/tetratricopeptide (TPR) repeat protein